LLDAWIVGSFAVRFPSFPFFIPLLHAHSSALV
jgi:hypothetical protein